MSSHPSFDFLSVVFWRIRIFSLTNFAPPGDLGSIPGRGHTKDFKNGTWYLLA